MDRFAELRAAIKTAELVDAHAHNIVAVDSAFQFLNCFSEAAGVALSYTPHTINFKISLRAVHEYRANSGVESITAKCLKAAGISTVLIDDGLELDKKHDIEWHKAFVPYVGRISRIEGVAEQIREENRFPKVQLLYPSIDGSSDMYSISPVNPN